MELGALSTEQYFCFAEILHTARLVLCLTMHRFNQGALSLYR